MFTAALSPTCGQREPMLGWRLVLASDWTSQMALELAEHDPIWDCRVACVRCNATIEVSVFAIEPRPAVVKQSLNELLIDFGWLPTSLGGYCRQHADRR